MAPTAASASCLSCFRPHHAHVHRIDIRTAVSWPFRLEVCYPSAPVQRGSYLVNGLLTCGNCHTPRGPDGVFAMDRQLSGGPQEWDRPTYKVRGANITPERETGIGSYHRHAAERHFARADHAL